MKKNIIYVLIDSLNYKHVKESPIDLMPFYKSLKSNALYCENMYSEAPYTEAALMSSICGQDVLDYGGYMFRYKNTPLTLFEAMQNKGYYTYASSYIPQCYPSSIIRGTMKYNYSTGYDPAALWSYRFSHYAKLFKNKKIQNEDYLIIYDMLADNFNSWLEWLVNLKNGNSNTNLIKKNSKKYDIDKILEKVQKEFILFKNNRKKYADTIFKKGKKHNFFKIGGFNQNNKIQSRDNMENISNELKVLAKRIKKMNYSLNKKNNKYYKKPLKTKLLYFLKHPSIFNLKNFIKTLRGSINALHDLDLNKRVNINYDSFKDGPSMRTHVDTFINWAKNYQGDKPYFALIHALDVHNPEEFFTYDSGDIDLIREEIKSANELLDKIPSSYYGSLTHDLSLNYIDNVIKYLYNQLKSNNLYDDTIVMICADHGFSFSGNPVRDSYVVNLFLENYNIPFLMTGTDYNGEITKLCESKDIPATICDIVDGVIPNEFSGRSILKDNNYDNLIIEYCGGGCPDILRRDIKHAAFNTKWFVGTLGKINEPLNCTEIYDLENDPFQYNNLINNKELLYNDNVLELIHSIEIRRQSILKTYHCI